MELLDALEQKVNDLLSENSMLKSERRRLEVQISELESRVLSESKLASIQELEDMLVEERKLRQATLGRIDSLIQRLENNNG